ncbi:Wee1-like protein kinase [Frankliniella fusca]|uniref:Wee1-like protein kinase n=1 Tax=Frankliniella fusca TaxID=407009 RepID=A0AAE1GTZ1_9NEOP|nr:Wee1-like protein kinase [Frankliniella fusca]
MAVNNPSAARPVPAVLSVPTPTSGSERQWASRLGQKDSIKMAPPCDQTGHVVSSARRVMRKLPAIVSNAQLPGRLTLNGLRMWSKAKPTSRSCFI